ncbi:MAG TPA: PIG-L family deacetylase [Streptosporangiaceae bacterium]|jgi:LmbE family N-acetylglucosaminyl deacetylase|nr:PIG-L family deacetylase [Streptosporangiaceae bacterium]
MTSALTTRVNPTGWLPARAPASDGRTNGQLTPVRAAAPGISGLPPTRTVLAVTARPGVESTALGGLLYAFGQAGARITLLSLTRGEASPFNSTSSRLETVRPWELQLASWLLGISSVTVADYPDGGLSSCPMPKLTDRVRRAIAEYAPDLILVLDPVAGNSDDARVARAVSLAARPVGVPVVSRTMPGASDGWLVELGAEADVAREVQRAAARAHASQSEVLPQELRRLDSLGRGEPLRWLVPAAIRPPAPREAEACLN